MTDRLLTPAEAAEQLGIGVKLLREHIRGGLISYIDVGRGLRRKRRMFHPDDLAAFVARQRGTEPCPSTSARRRARSTITSSSSTGSGFLARLAAEENQRPARSNARGGRKPKLPSGHRAEVVPLR